jgi:hypothetical protein
MTQQFFKECQRVGSGNSRTTKITDAMIIEMKLKKICQLTHDDDVFEEVVLIPYVKKVQDGPDLTGSPLDADFQTRRQPVMHSGGVKKLKNDTPAAELCLVFVFNGKLLFCSKKIFFHEIFDRVEWTAWSLKSCLK